MLNIKHPLVYRVECEYAYTDKRTPKIKPGDLFCSLVFDSYSTAKDYYLKCLKVDAPLLCKIKSIDKDETLICQFNECFIRLGTGE